MCVASVCWYVLVSSSLPLFSKCLKISQFVTVVLFLSFPFVLSPHPTHLLSYVALWCWFSLYSQIPPFVTLSLLFDCSCRLLFLFILLPLPWPFLSLFERHWITFSVVQASCRYEGNFPERDLLWSFNFENSFQSFKFWMVYI